jgi:hypothetical protein
MIETGMRPGVDADARPIVEKRHVIIAGEVRTLRLLRIGERWLASIDTEHGPTLGADHSPYLAAARALEPIGIGLAEAMAMVGPVRPAR